MSGQPTAPQPAALATRPHSTLPAVLPSVQLDYAQAMQMAEKIAGASLCPEALRGKPADVFIVLMRGAEMGLSPMLALQNLYVVKGKTGISADLMRARCQAHPDCLVFEITKATATGATLLVHKRQWQEPIEVAFSIEEAKAAQLVKDDSNWRKWPQDMCVARATSRAARRYFPDVVAGIYTKEELEELAPPEPERPAIVMPKATAAPATTTPTEEPPPPDAAAAEETTPEPGPQSEPERTPPPAFGRNVPEEAWQEVRATWHQRGTVSEAQVRRLFAIATKSGWTGDQVTALIEDRIGCKPTELAPMTPYDKVVGIFQDFKPATE